MRKAMVSKERQRADGWCESVFIRNRSTFLAAGDKSEG